MALISVVVPAFNEEEVIDSSYARLAKALKGLNSKDKYEIVFVNDGSKDKTFDMLKAIAAKDKRIKIINFARNFGHQCAITAGMSYAKGDAVVVIDADMQDPPEIIPQMVEKWKAGSDVIYGKRLSRAGETKFKLWTAKMFYRILNKLCDIDMPVDTGDFRLIDRKVCDAMNKLPEHNRYMRGLIVWVGFKHEAIEYKRDARLAGETKYPLKKMIKLATDGLLSFSSFPLRFVTKLGTFITCSSILFAIYLIITNIIANNNYYMNTPYLLSATWNFACIIAFFSGLIILSIGMVGEYVARINEDTRGRPLYTIREIIE